MAKDAKTTTPEPAKAETPKRTRLTDEQRVAKLEAELQAARNKAEAKAKAEAAKLREQQAKLITQRDKLNVKINEIDTQLGEPVPAAPAKQDDAAA